MTDIVESGGTEATDLEAATILGLATTKGVGDQVRILRGYSAVVASIAANETEEPARAALAAAIAAREAAEREKAVAVRMVEEHSRSLAAAEKERDEARKELRNAHDRAMVAEHKKILATENHAVAALAAERVANAGLRAVLTRLIEKAADVVFECDGVFDTKAPSRVAYNAAFDELAKARAALSAAPPLPKGALRAASVEDANDLLALRQQVEDTIGAAQTDSDTEGWITAYHFKTGAIHRLLKVARDIRVGQQQPFRTMPSGPQPNNPVGERADSEVGGGSPTGAAPASVPPAAAPQECDRQHWHYAGRNHFSPMCGASVPNHGTTETPARVTCSDCLRLLAAAAPQEQQGARLMEFNINDYVWVRLTDVGRAVYADHWRPYCNPIPAPKERDGWAEFQLWDLIHVFGAAIGNGLPVPFETTIRFAAPASAASEPKAPSQEEKEKK